MNIPLRFSPRAALLVVAAFFALYPAYIHADIVVFNTLGPGDTYAHNVGVSVEGSNDGPFEIAAQFTAGASGFLANIDLGLTKFNSASGAVNVFLYGDAAGIPDTANQTFLGAGTATAIFGSTNNSIISLAVAGNVAVTQGLLYWLVLKPGDPNTDVVWNQASPQVLGLVAGSDDDVTWPPPSGPDPLPAFRIRAVPEASALILLLFGGASIVGSSASLRLRLKHMRR